MNTIEFGKCVVPVIGSYDTVIVGGGTAGASAGISAAREGNKTIIVEKSLSLGGAAVGALVNPMMESFVIHEQNFYEIENRLKEKGASTRDGIMNIPLLKIKLLFWKKCFWNIMELFCMMQCYPDAQKKMIKSRQL